MGCSSEGLEEYYIGLTRPLIWKYVSSCTGSYWSL